VFVEALGGKEVLSQRLLWVSIATAFVIANLPPTLINAVLLQLLRLLRNSPGSDASLRYVAENLTDSVFVPVKELLFLGALLVMSFPIVRCLTESKDLWRGLVLRRIAGIAASLFVGLAILVFPYSYPSGLNSNVSGLSGLGMVFGHMSAAPFR